MNTTTLISFELATHIEPVRDFLIKYLITNPKTTKDDEKLIEAFTQTFPHEYLEGELDSLYSIGIASRFAMFEFYISDDIIETINDSHKVNRTPTWCE